MQAYVRATNQKLSLFNSTTTITDWYHATGNFVVQTPDSNPLRVADELSLALGTQCALLTNHNCIVLFNPDELDDNPVERRVTDILTHETMHWILTKNEVSESYDDLTERYRVFFADLPKEELAALP
jgi:hypothetical protein